MAFCKVLELLGLLVLQAFYQKFKHKLSDAVEYILL
jgi:hypothetical protein